MRMTTPNHIPDAEELLRMCQTAMGWHPDTILYQLGNALKQRLDAESAAKPERMFPLCGVRDVKIPWRIAELAYIGYARRYGNRQSLDDLAMRGGFHTEELDEFLPDWKELCAKRGGDVPEGYVLVPREPTEEMQKAAEASDIASDFNYPWQYVELYKAMIAAAPEGEK